MSGLNTSGIQPREFEDAAEAAMTNTMQLDGDPPTTSNPLPANAAVHFHLFGMMRVTSHCGLDILPQSREAQALLGCLCLAQDSRISTTDLARLLWDLPPDADFADRLKSVFRDVRSAWRPLPGRLLRIRDGFIRLDLKQCWVDAVMVLESARFSHDVGYCDLSAALDGELLEGLEGVSEAFDAWLRQQRSKVKTAMRRWLVDRLELVERTTGDPVQTIALARNLVRLDPENMRASIALTYALAEAGRYALALREYERSQSIRPPGFVDKGGHEASALYETILTCAAIEERVTGETIRSALRTRGLAAPMALLKRDRPRVGILPFLAAGSSSGESQISLTACHDVAVALERFRWFEIVPPDIMVSNRRTSSDREEHGELDYVIDGSVSRSGNDFTILVRVLDMLQYARPVWSDRFRVRDDQVDKLDDLFAQRVVARVVPFISFLEGRPRPKRRRGTAGLLLLAIPLMYSMERRRYEEAGQLIQCALKLGDARALAWAAQWGVYHVGQGWSKDVAGTIHKAQQYGLDAIRLDPGNSDAMGIYAHVCSFFSKEFDAANRMFGRSLKKNPSSAFIWALSAPTCCYMGDPGTALARMSTYRELAPFDPYFCFFQHFYTIALMFKGDYHRAAQFGRRAVEANLGFTNGYKPLIAALGHLGRREEAQQYSDRLLSLEPGFTMGHFAKNYPFKYTRDRDRYLEGLRLAGAPE